MKSGLEAFDHEGKALDPKQAALVFLDYVRAAFDEETRLFNTISVGELVKFEHDGTLRFRTDELSPEGEPLYEILGVYNDARRKLDAFLQMQRLRKEIEELSIGDEDED